MPLGHAPAPWRREDHGGKGYRVVDATGQPVCFLHYPRTLEQHGNLRLLLRCPELLETLKRAADVLRLAAALGRGEAGNPVLERADSLVREIEGLGRAEPRGDEVI